MKDGRGQHMVAVGQKTRDRIAVYIKENPNALRKEIKDSLGISWGTLRKHLADLGH